jgi:hypothetical protein
MAVLKAETCGWCYEQKGLFCNNAVLTECKGNFYYVLYNELHIQSYYLFLN